jgi:hypothetical protein
MPVTIKKKKGGCVQVSTPNGVKAKCTTKKKAEAQKRIIEAADKKGK